MLFPSVRRVVRGLTRRRSRKAGLKRAAPRFRPMLAILEDRTLPSTVNWVGGTGDWSVANNWLDANTMTHHVPGATDDAVINAGVTVTHSTGTDSVYRLTSQAAFVLSGGTLDLVGVLSTINSTFTLSGGTLRRNELTVSGAASWTSGTIGGFLTIAATGSLAISTTGTKVLSGALATRGPVTWSAGQINAGGCPVISNSSTWHIQGNDAIGSFNRGQCGPGFRNSGTVQKSAGTGTSTIGIPLYNSGTVDVQSSTLSLSDGGSSSGAFTASAAAATLAFSGGTHTLSSASRIGGLGSIVFSGGTTNLAGSYTVSGGTTISGGTANFNSPASAAALSQSGGTLGGSGPLTVSGAASWTSGTMQGTGTTTIAATGRLAISTTDTKVLSQRTLATAGPVTWSAGEIDSGVGATISNSSTWDIQGDDAINYDLGGATPTFSNSGTVQKSAGTDTSTIGMALNNSGAVDVRSGTLSLLGGGSSIGAFTASVAAATLEFSGGMHTLAANSSVGGPGSIVFSGGTTNLAGSYTVSGGTTISGGAANFNSPASAAALSMSGGTLGGSGALTVSGAASWTSGTMQGTGTTTIAATGSLAISTKDTKVLSQRTLATAGPVTWSAGEIDSGEGATISNSSTWHIQGNDPIAFNLGGATPTFSNSGTVQKSAGTDTSTIGMALNNSGTVDVHSGTLYLSGGFNNFSGMTLTGGTYLVTGTFQFTNANILTNAATLVLDGPAAALVDHIGADALTNLSANLGILELQNGATHSTAGVFSDAGTLVVGPGSAFTVTGTYRQTGTANVQATGTLTLQGPFSNIDPSSGTLTGGTYVIAGTFEFSDAATSPIVTNAATLVLDGTAAQITDLSGNDALANSLLAIATGASFTVLDGYTFTTPTDFSDAGTLTVGAGSTFNTSGVYTQTDGATVLANGTLAAVTVNLNGGSLTGSGTIAGDLVNAAQVSPGYAVFAGVLSVIGNYTQTSGGALNLKIGGTHPTLYDRLLVEGVATLDGVVNLNFEYAAAANDSFTPLIAGSVTGTFAAVDAMNLDPSLQVMPLYDPADVTFTLVPHTDASLPAGNAAPGEARNAEPATPGVLKHPRHELGNENRATAMLLAPS